MIILNFEYFITLKIFKLKNRESLLFLAVCRSVADCSDGEKCINNKCMVSCIAHSQCLVDQACVNGGCVLGCRSNKNCPTTESCINNKCQGMSRATL